jgi:hypothetical protein
MQHVPRLWLHAKSPQCNQLVTSWFKSLMLFASIELFGGNFISVRELHLWGNTSTTSYMNRVKGLLHSHLGMQSLVQEAANRTIHWLHYFSRFLWNNLEYHTTNHISPTDLPMPEKQVISAAAESNRQASQPRRDIRYSWHFSYWSYIKFLFFATGIHSCSAYSEEFRRVAFFMAEARRVKLKWSSNRDAFYI